MPRNKVIFSLIVNETDRKVSYKKRHIGFLKKAQELMTLCDIEIAAIIYSPYSDEPKKNLELVRETMKNNVSDNGSTSNVPQSTPSTTMTFIMPSSIVDPPLYASVPSPMTPQMGPSEEIPPMGTLIQMNNSQNYSSDIPESPSLIELLNWNNDVVVTLLEDLSLNNINDLYPNPTNNI
ncbi:hypothetical protein H5410_005215 [Solanum commersonii]|uniref:MADS-box domain-containing protein n=1 Tax=Solanum commersonii TaxID=4109 RepID=A0A9J6A615_SOLCO|nr:hypothetical protein H5410_005215 [Solanum commersonii]